METNPKIKLREAGRTRKSHTESGNDRSIVKTRQSNGSDRPLDNLAGWLLRNQSEVLFGLIALLFSTHTIVSKARPHTAKFFTLSYYNARTGNYAAGYDDFFFIAFCIVLLMGLRAACMQSVLVPLAKRWGISKRKDAVRFSEQGWILLYYSIMWPLGVYIYYQSPYFLNLQELWTNWPQRELDGLAKTYVLVQWAFWSQQLVVIHMEARRKDYWQILTHHLVTIALIAASYAYHHTRVGTVILVLMDVIELIFPLAKCLKYLGFTTVCDVLFGLFMVTWLVSRHVFYVMICWSIYSDAPGLLTSACFRGTAEDLQGPFPTSNSWSHLLEPFRDPAGMICSNDSIIFGFLSYLLVLEVIMIMWFALIVRVAIRVLKGSSAEDVRSDSEMEEEVVEYAEAGPIEEEVGVEGIDLKQWERRTGVKRAQNSTGISLPGHSDRKEFLNRIGCEKQID